MIQTARALLLALTVTLSLTALPTAAADRLPEPAPVSAEVGEIRAAVSQGDLERAVELGEALVERAPDDGTAWLWLGRAYGQQALEASILRKAGYASSCREAFEKAVALDPANAQAQWDLMQFYLNAPGFLGGGRDKADASREALRAIHPVWGHLADAQVTWRADEDLAATERHYRAALAQMPREDRARIGLSSLLQQQERWDEVRAYWDAAVAADAGDLVAVYQQGRLAALTGDELETGEQALRSVLAADPLPESLSRAATHWRLGQVLDRLGRREDAVKALAEAVRLDPRLEDAKKLLASLRG
jgi:tetratricopeptide (TPR) repeat protein